MHEGAQLPIIDSAQLAEAEAKLAKLDPVLGELIELQKPIAYQPRGDYFFSLCRSIIGQQVSVAAAAAILGRFEAAAKFKPDRVVKLSDADMKSIGLSRQKTAYIRDLAQHFVEDPEIYKHLDKLDDQAVMDELIKVKGVGLWTAQMFLMFTLSRPDVFAAGDVGLQRAMKQLYGWDAVPNEQELIEVAERWRPYRSVACWHLWRSLHNTA